MKWFNYDRPLTQAPPPWYPDRVFPVALSLGGLLIRVVALAVLPRVTSTLARAPKTELEIAVAPRVEETPAVEEPALKIRKVASPRWANSLQIISGIPSLQAQRSPTSARAPPFVGAGTRSRAYLHRRSYPINSSDPSGLRDLTYDMKRKTGSFNPGYDHASAGRGIGFTTKFGLAAAAGGARALNLLIKGGQALRYGAAGVTVFAAEHGNEIGEMVEGAVMPIGHPIQPGQFGGAGAGLDHVSGTITNKEGIAIVEDLAVAGSNVNWRGFFRALEGQAKDTGANSIRIEGSILGDLSTIERVLGWAQKTRGYKVTRTDPRGGYPQYLLEKDF